jgi:hypothetical protein
MSVKSATFHWLECDRCGCRVASEYGEGMVHHEVREAEDAATDQDWHVEGGHHLCESCTPPHGPDWDGEHEEYFNGGPELDCPWCKTRAEEKTDV